MEKLSEEVKWKRWQVWLAFIAPVVLIVTQIVIVTTFLKDVEARTFANEKSIIEHNQNESLHMKLEDKIKMFVTRLEYNAEVQTVKEDLKEIKQDIKKLLSKK